MSVHVKQMLRIEAHVGRIRVVETELPRHFSLLRAGQVDSFLGQIDEQEIRDAHELFGDLIAYFDAADPALEQAS